MPTPKSYQPLENSTRQAVPHAGRVHSADPNESVSVTVLVRRRPDAPPLRSDEQWDATPPAERQYITDEEFATRYGAAQSDLDAVAAFGAKHHLRVLESSSSQRLVILSGKVADVNEAFGVELGHYEVQRPSEEAPTQDSAHAEPESTRYRGYEGPVHLPPKLTPVVEGVFGLDTRRLARRAGVPTVTTPLTPPGVSELYDFPAPGHHIRHETIGLLEFSDPVIGQCGYVLSDIDDYFTTTLGIGPGYITPQLTDIGVNGATNSPGGPADVEVALDIEVAGSVAQGAPISVYFTTWDEMGWILAVKRAVHPLPGEHRPSVLSISWGWPELDTIGNVTWSPAAIAAVSATLQEAAMFGMTVLAASGDYGSSCGQPDGRAHVLYPTSDPWVTSVGGTQIGNVSGSSFTEDTWTNSGVTGGGISDIFALPHWQRHAHVPVSANPGGHHGRGVPDIAGYADGYDIVLGGATVAGIGGTSEAAPLYAGLVAILNARLRRRVGYLNPTFYRHHRAIFRDVDDGSSNATFGAPGYISGSGWDACTGWGSIRGTALLRVLRR